jgi:hypothetical protein
MSKLINRSSKTLKFNIGTPCANQPAWYGKLRPKEIREFADGKEWEIEIQDDGPI